MKGGKNSLKSFFEDQLNLYMQEIWPAGLGSSGGWRLGKGGRGEEGARVRCPIILCVDAAGDQTSP